VWGTRETEECEEERVGLSYGIGREGEGRLENSEQEPPGKHPTHFSFVGLSCAGPPISRHLYKS